MATSLSLITEYIARQADPKDMPSIVFWALGELRRVQTSTSSIGEVLTNHDNAIKSILEAIGEGGDGTPGDCSCEDGADGKDGSDGTDGRGVMVFQQSSVPSSSLSMPGDIWFSDNDILIMNLSRQWVSISGGSADIINDSIVSLATTWSSSRLTSEFEQYLRKDEARHKLYGLLHSDVDTATPIAETDGLFYQSGKFRPGNRMEFMYPYVNGGTYYPQQTVLVDGWTMAANKTTTDYPAPFTNGVPFSIYDGTAPQTQSTAKQIIFGGRYTNPTTAYQLVSYFVNTVLDQDYDVYLISDPLGDQILTNLGSFVATTTGWTKFNIAPTIIGIGSTFDLVAVTTEPADTPVTADATYNYLTPQNTTVPAAGQIQHARSQADVMAISHTDDIGGDRTALITGLVLGDKISAANGGEWIVQTNTNQGTYSSITVTPATTGSAGVQTITFETTVATPIDYMEDVDFWLTSPYTVNGIISIDNTYPNATINDNAYGVDVEVINISLSEDWDIVAPGDAAASGSQALSRDEKTWVQSNSTSVEVDTAITSGNTWTEIARFPIPVDTGVKASLTVDASRTDAYGKYNAEYAALAFNNAGALDVNGAEKFELGPALLNVRAAADGTDLIFEVRGAVMQDWAWRMLIFFREIQ